MNTTTQRLRPVKRTPHTRRFSVTVPELVYLALEVRSMEQGRSLSNLAAYLLERAITVT